MIATVFANCAIVDGSRNERREDHHVLVEDGLIREVSDRPDFERRRRERSICKGGTLMPGLIDAHVHVVAVDQVLSRLWPNSRRALSRCRRRASSKACCSAALRPCATPVVRMAGWRRRSMTAWCAGRGFYRRERR